MSSLDDDRLQRKRRYNREWRHANRDKFRVYHKRWYDKNKGKIHEDRRQWRIKNPKKQKEYDRRAGENLKRKAVIVVNGGDVKCARPKCGCDDLRLLEFNYKNGGHTKLAHEGKLPNGKPLYRGIIAGKIDPSLFNVLCKAHNAIDHIEKQFGVTWKIQQFQKTKN